MRPIVALCFIGITALASAQAFDDAYMSHGRMPDSSQKVIAEIRDQEKRKIPIEVAIRARSQYSSSQAIAVTVTVTNLFDPPLVLNSRLLVNHERLPGELSFLITDPHGQRCEIQRLVSPLEVRDDDFVLLARGMSIQRTVDLADFFDLHKRGVYKIQAIYHNSIDRIVGDQHAWLGMITSDPTEIELK